MLHRHRGGIGDVRADITHLHDITEHLPTERFRNDLLRDNTGRDTSRGFAGTAATAAAVIAETVLRVEAVIGMTGAIQLGDVTVILAPLIGVADQNREAGAGRAAFEDAGQNLRQIGFIPLRDNMALPRPTAVEIDQ